MVRQHQTRNLEIPDRRFASSGMTMERLGQPGCLSFGVAMVCRTRLEGADSGDLRKPRVNGFARSCLQKGSAMLIRGKIGEIQGQAANASAPETILPASLPTLLLGGLLLLIGP
jgi:hypothetical protein